MELKYRKLQIDEAQVFWNMMNALDQETKYMLYEPEERTKDLAGIKYMIELSQNDKNFLLVAEFGEEIVGYICAKRGQLNRILHTAYIVVGIREKYRSKGIGTEFFKYLDKWADEKHMIRLELTVVSTNTSAIKLYEKSGFKIEGTKKKAMLIDGIYEDEYYMAKILNV